MGSKSRQNVVIPSTSPEIRVTMAAWLVPLFEKTPNKNTVATGGAMAAAILLMASMLQGFPNVCWAIIALVLLQLRIDIHLPNFTRSE